jgi:transposase-like protein
MMICPNLKCRKVLQVPAKYRGQQVRCHYCNMTFAVPTGKPAEKAAGEAKGD